jgi:hypothetical protein
MLTQEKIDEIRQHQRDFRSEVEEWTEGSAVARDYAFQKSWQLYHDIDTLIVYAAARHGGTILREVLSGMWAAQANELRMWAALLPDEHRGSLASLCRTLKGPCVCGCHVSEAME